MSKHLLVKVFPLIVVGLVACAGITTNPDYPLTHLYEYRWINTAKPEEPQSTARIAKQLADYDVVVFGEMHGHPGIHLAQMQLLKALYGLNTGISLSLEQFERDTQATLDAYLAGEIGEQTMRDQARAWDNYATSYRPLVEYAKRQQLPVIAANAPKDAITCIGREGLGFLDTMVEEDRKHIAREIDVSEGAYKDKYMEFLGSNASHGGGSSEEASEEMQKMAERSFAAQVTRDDTMAESIAQHMQHNPQRQVIHLTGQFHSEAFLGMVERLSKRMPALKIAVIDPVLSSDDHPVWDEETLSLGTVLILVQPLPEKFVQEDNAMQWSHEILKKRMDTKCALSPK